MKRYLSFILLLALMLSVFGVGHAVTVTIGDGTSSASDPFHAYWGFGRSLSLFTADQIGQTGQITSLGWSVASTSATAIPYRIFIATTTATELTQMLWDSTNPADDTFVGMASLVKVGSYAFSTTGWHTFVLDTPFAYTGGNLLVGVESNYGGGGAYSYPNFHYTDSDPNTHQIWRADNNPPAGLGSVDPWRPNIQLEIGDIPTNPVFVLSPTEWDFGRVIINETVSKTFTIRNNGVGTLNVTGLSPTSDGFFTVLNAPAWPVALTAGQSTTFDIQYAPTAVGPHTATFTITDGRANTNLTVNGECHDPVIYTYPFTDGFEVGQTDGQPVQEWTQHLGGYTQYWMANSSQADYNRAPRNGAFNATLRYYGDAWLMRPFSMQGGVSYDVEIWARQDVSNGAVLSLHYGTEGTIAGMTNAIGTPHNVVNGDYQRVYGNFTPPADGVYWIGIHGTTTIDPWYISIDDFTVQHTPTVPVLSIAPAEYDFGRVSIHGTASQTFTITNTGVGTLNLTGISPTTDGFFSVTDAPGFPLGLATNESATFNIQYAPTAAGPHAATFTVNHADGSGTVTVNGECFDPTVYTYPFTEGFEVGQTDGQKVQEWTQHLGGSYTLYWMANSSATSYNRAPRNGAFNATLRYYGDAWLMRPFSMQGGQGYDVEIWARQDATSGATLSLHYGTEGTIAGMTNTIAGPASIINGDYQVVRGRFTPAADGIYWIGIHGVATYDPWYISIDDFSVQHEPTATLPPILVSPEDGAVNVSKYGVDLTWEPDFAGATPDYYAVYLATDSATIYDEYRWETTNTSFNPVLEDNTFSFVYEQRYYWTVGAIFGTDEVVQETSRFFDIEADHTVTAFPWTENFDSIPVQEMPVGWKIITSHTGADRRPWRVLESDSIGSHSGTKCTAVSWHTDYPKNEWMITPPISMQEGLTYNISFAAKGDGWEGVSEKLKLHWATIPYVASLTANEAMFDNPDTSGYTDWTLENVSFTAPSTGLYFFGWHAYSEADVNYIAVDTITISEGFDVDLAIVGIGGHTVGAVGDPLVRNMTVRNMGTLPQSNYIVYLKEAVTNNVLAQELITETLNPGETAVHTLSWTPAAEGVVTLYAEVVLAGDQELANNVSDPVEVTIYQANTKVLFVGDAATNYGAPFFPFTVTNGDVVAETVYLASEMQATDGVIHQIAYYSYFAEAMTLSHNVQIWMKNTDATDLEAGWLPWDGYQLVYDGPVEFSGGTHEIVIPLTTSFNYTGGNLAIRTSKTFDMSHAAYQNLWLIDYYGPYDNRTRFETSDAGELDHTNPTGTNVTYIYPNITFFMSTTNLVETLDAPVVTMTIAEPNALLEWELIPYAWGYNVYASTDPYGFGEEPLGMVIGDGAQLNNITGIDKLFIKVTGVTYRDFNRSQTLLRNLEPREIKAADMNTIVRPERKTQSLTIE